MSRTALTLTWLEVRSSPYACHYRSAPVDYGVSDTSGRAVGGYATIERVASTYFVATRATRDGKTFGPIPRDTRVDSLEKAQALAASKLEASRKRFVRKFGPAAGGAS